MAYLIKAKDFIVKLHATHAFWFDMACGLLVGFVLGKVI